MSRIANIVQECHSKGIIGWAESVAILAAVNEYQPTDEARKKYGTNACDVLISLRIDSEIISDVLKAERIFLSSAFTWEQKYDRIFDMRLADKIRCAGYAFDYCDPDTSYEQDVRALMAALTEFKERIISNLP